MNRAGKTPRFKKQRRVIVELPGLGKPGALARRPYPPGQHGLRRKKYSDYALQLEEKQKILFHYGLREAQMLRFITLAKKSSNANWVSKLIGLLERRLDNVVFRLGFTPSIPAAKQMIVHGKVYVNGQRLDIRSAILSVGDRVELTKDAYQNQVYLQAKQNPRLPLPDYLKKEETADGEVGVISFEPDVSYVPFPFNPGHITSYYALRGGV
ncbi:MAG: 30S ribosomal protein S4 [Bdellovibrionales bacterium]|jgi:small subunit ribosomal protein S4|nr:30S ribosomal protein S4 [Bdellovibrionales bacterium]